MQDIHGIRGPVIAGFDPGPLKIMLMVLAVIIVAAIIFFLIRSWIKKRNHPKSLENIKESLTPYDAALKEMDILFQRQMTDLRLFYFELTIILRKYISLSFGINAREMTSQQFIKSIHNIDLSRELKQDIERFQKISDPVKYAGIIPENDQVKNDLLFIKTIILQIEKNLLAPAKSAEQKGDQ